MQIIRYVRTFVHQEYGDRVLRMVWIATHELKSLTAHGSRSNVYL